jgi:hypothetical protein
MSFVIRVPLGVSHGRLFEKLTYDLQQIETHMFYTIDTSGKSLLALYQNLLVEMCGQSGAGLGVDDIRYRLKEWIASAPTPPAIFLSLQEANPDVSITIYKQLDALASETNNLKIAVYCCAGGAIEKRLMELDPALGATPGHQLTLEPPTIGSYTDLANLVLRDVAPDYSLSDEAAALCATYALEHLYVSDDIENLLRVAHKLAMLSDPLSTCIEVAHINAAYNRTKYDHLNVIKNPPENTPFVQAYAAIFLETLNAQERAPFFVPTGDLYDRFKKALAEQPVPLIVAPNVRFERILGQLIEIGAFFYEDVRQIRISIKPAWCLKDNFEAMAYWDGHPTPPVREETPTPEHNAVIDTLTLGHLAALKAIIETYIDMGDQPPTLSQVYPRYVQICTELGLQPVRRKPGFWKLIGSLKAKNLIRTERRGPELCVDPIRPQALFPGVQSKLLAAAPPPTHGAGAIALNNAPAQQLVIAAVEKTANPSALLSDIYQMYITRCQERGEIPATKDRFKQILKTFESRGLIRRERCYVGCRPDSLISTVAPCGRGKGPLR